MPLIGNDIVLNIGIGPKATAGLAFTGIGTANYRGVAKSVHIHESIKKIDTSALGDASEKNRFFKTSRTLEIDSVVPSAGYTLRNRAGGGLSNDLATSFIGCFIRVETAAGPLTAGDAWHGVIESWDWTAADGSEQVEKIMIDLTVDGVPG